MRALHRLLLVGTMIALAGCDADRDNKLGDMPEGGGSYDAPDGSKDSTADTAPQAGPSDPNAPQAGAMSGGGIPGIGSEGQKSAGDAGVTTDR